MRRMQQRIVASILLFVQFAAIAAPIVPINNHPRSYNDQGRAYSAQASPSSLDISSNQLGLSGPLNVATTYSNLTGAYLSGQFLKALNDEIGVNVLGEYGANQYRLNGTLGLLLTAKTFFKITAEQLAQRLPFLFTTGNVEERVKQNAFGARVQRDFDFTNVSFGGYAAKAPNKRLDSLTFTSNGSNCNGFESGLTCINERNIAGASTSGADVGMGLYVSRNTYLEGKLYYDSVHYNTLFSAQSAYNAHGYGGGIYAQHLLADNWKCSLGAEVRRIYDTDNLALSWMPPLKHASGTELSITAQHVASHNQTPNNNMLGLKVTFFADRVNYQAPIYGLNSMPVVDNIASWISQPAVKMNQVLAISEEYVHLAAATITSISPNSGPLVGGNSVTISGTNFPSGVVVRFGQNIAAISSMTNHSISVIIPPGSQLGGVPVFLTTPDGTTITYENGYLYTNGIAPIITAIAPTVGSVTGGTVVSITGANFVAGKTVVTIGNQVIPASAVTVNSSTSLTFTTPSHSAGTVMITVGTPAGPSTPVAVGFTYVDAPTVSLVNPTSGPATGGTNVMVQGSNFVPGATRVTLGGVVIPATAVVVNSASSLSFNTPAHPVGQVSLGITSPGGSVTVAGGFTYTNNAVTSSSMNPHFGSTAGGTAVTINGSHFVAGSTSVTIGGITVPASAVTVQSPTSLQFTSPPHAAGNVDVFVTTPTGSSAFVPGGFTYEDLPLANALTPTLGSTQGGTAVTVIGNHFVTDDTSVIIGGIIIPAASVTVNSANSLTFITPPHSAGNAAVMVQTSAGISSAVPNGFTYVSAPTAASLTPAFGSVSGGTTVTITGTNFVAGATSVTIGGTVVSASSVTVNSTTSLTFITPAHAAGNAAVSVTTAGGTSAAIAGGFTYEGAPTASSLSPNAGSTAGGTVITISGTNFIPDNTSVTIGGTVVSAAAVTVNSSTSLTFTSPAHSAGNVAVTVSTAGGTSANIPGGFTYNTYPTANTLSPAFGSAAGGTSVTLSGSDFIVGATSVTIGGIVIPAAAVTVTSSTSLTFVAPAHNAGNASVTVTTPGGTSLAVPGGFTYAGLPTATSLNPNTGSSAGGVNVTVNGTNFVTGNTSVSIGGTVVAASAVTVTSPTSLTFITPAHTAGTAEVLVSTAGGSSAPIPGGFTYVDAPTATGLSPGFGPVAGGTPVTVTGSGFVVGATSVTVGGTVVPASAVTVDPSTTSLSFSTPAHAAGTVAVTVTTAGGISGVVPGGFTYAAAPTATALNPSSGPVTGGTVVTVNGTQFIAGDTSVTIGGQTVAATVNSPTSLSFSTPAHAAGNVAVTVATAGGVSMPIAGGFTYTAAPTATGLTPGFGPVIGGTPVTVTGSGFVVGATSVTVGGTVVPASAVIVDPSTTSLSFSTPAHAAGTVAVTVTTAGGTSGVVPGGFTYEEAPTAAAISPASGPVVGGTLATVSGSHFVAGNTTVSVDGTLVSASSVTVISATSLTFITPAHAAGMAEVLITTAGGSSAPIPGGFTYVDAPTATGLSPGFGPANASTLVTVNGSNFIMGATLVTIGGMDVEATVQSPTSLTFTAPAHAAGTVTVTVTTPGGTSAAVPGGFTYEEVPTATAISPASGPVVGGTLATVSGSHFVAGNTTVSVDGTLVSASSVTVISATSLTFITPAHAAGMAEVLITTAGGSSAPIPGGFTYVDAPTATGLSPGFGPANASTLVTVNGSNFIMGATLVTIGGMDVEATVQSPTSLTFTAPAHAAGTVTVTVTTPGGTSAAVPGGFTYEEAPTATALSPASGSINGGTAVTISGTNFVPGDTSVRVDGIDVAAPQVTVNSSTSLTFITPAHVAGTVAVTVHTSSGSVSVPGGFTYTNDAPLATLLTPDSGPTTGNTLVTIAGDHFVVGATSVTIGGIIIPAANVTVHSATSLEFHTPVHAAGNVAVSVTTPSGTSSNVPNGFTYTSPVTVSSLTPTFGPTAGGATVTVYGTNFALNNTSVTIGGIVIPAGSVNVISSTQLEFITPINTAGNVSVYITVAGINSGFVPGGYTYLNPPTANILNPQSGPATGGTVVTVNGTQFIAGDTSVTIGGQTVAATVNSPTSLSFSTPAHAAGNVAVTVATAGGVSMPIAGGFTYTAAPTATGLSPGFGPVAGGTPVTVTGSGFVVGATSVTVGGTVVPASAVTVDPSTTSLSFSTPAHAAGTVVVTVTTAGGTSGVVPGGFTYAAAPTATALNPSSGPVTGGTVVTVNGTQFIAGDTSVTIGGQTVAATVNSPTSLSFSTPAHAAGNVAVTVATAGGVSMPIAGGFTYTAAPTATGLSPGFGPVAGGTPVTVTGSGFVVGATSVTVGGTVVPASAVTVDPSTTSLSFSTPAHAAGTVAVTVTTAGGISGVVPGGFTYAAAPTATALNPSSGPVTGGTVVTVNGTQFIAGDTSVTIGGQTVAATVNSPTSLSFSTPAHAAGNVAVTVATAGGVSMPIAGGFTYTAAPTATGLSPGFGPVAGGTSVTVTGSGFVVGATAVTVGGTVVPASAVTVDPSTTSLSFSTPAHAAGTVVVTVTTAGGTSGVVPGGFTYAAAPTATALNPSSGPVTGGTVVTVNGTQFIAGDTSVTIGGQTVAATVNSPTSLSFSTPAHAAGNVAVTVATAGGVSMPIAGGFTYTAAPTATGLTPGFGPVAGGTPVTVTGSGFVVGATAVTIGGTVVPAAAVTVDPSTTSLSFSTPAHAAGTVAVTVTTAGGTSSIVPGGFTYAAAPTATALNPASGPVAGGTVVTVSGTNFIAGDTSVTIGGQTVAATVNSPTSLSFSTPAHAAGNVAVTVATAGGTTTNIPDGFTYLAAPTVNSLNPAFGPVTGGTSVVISGTGFVTNATSVTIGGAVLAAAAVTVNSPTSLTFNTPAHAAGNVAVFISTPGGSSGLVPGGFTYAAVPTATSLTPVSGSTLGGTLVTITGTNFIATDTQVTIGGVVVPAAQVTVNSPTSLSFATPARAAGNVTVSVATSGGVSSNIAGGYTYIAPPTAASLSPTSGTTAGGTAVTITGTNFIAGNTLVTLGGTVIPAGAVTVNSPTSLRFSTPNHTAGTVAASVTTAGGTSNNIPGGYTYLAPSISSCTAPIPTLLGIQLVTCVGANLTLFDTTFLKVSGGGACSTFPTQQIIPSINILGATLLTVTDIPLLSLPRGLIGCNVQLCSNSSCSILGGTVGPVLVTQL